jgi:serine protease inhibitor
MFKIHSLLTLSLALSSLLLAEPNQDLSSLTKSHTQFALSLYKAAQTTPQNFVFSPNSVATCLSMVYLGARGETSTQMQAALHLDIDRKNLAQTTFLLNNSLQPRPNDPKSYTLKSANALFVDQGVFLLTDFRYAIEKQLKGFLSKLNFSKPELALSTINDWVSQETQKKIPHLLSAEDVNAQTQLVLVSALYFQGSWASNFPVEGTHDWPFHPDADTSLSVKMMQQNASFPYFENPLIQLCALPFKGLSNAGGTLALVALLPKSAENFEVMKNELPNEFTGWLSSLKPQDVSIKLPKFSSTTHLDLRDTLEKLGMEDAFGPDANFMGIDGMRDLFLNKVIHETFFSIDENGATGAVATAATMQMKSAPKTELPVEFCADHPFLYFIVDLKSQEVLFMGEMVQPGSK